MKINFNYFFLLILIINSFGCDRVDKKKIHDLSLEDKWVSNCRNKIRLEVLEIDSFLANRSINENLYWKETFDFYKKHKTEGCCWFSFYTPIDLKNLNCRLFYCRSKRNPLQRKFIILKNTKTKKLYLLPWCIGDNYLALTLQNKIQNLQNTSLGLNSFINESSNLINISSLEKRFFTYSTPKVDLINISNLDSLLLYTLIAPAFNLDVYSNNKIKLISNKTELILKTKTKSIIQKLTLYLNKKNTLIYYYKLKPNESCFIVITLKNAWYINDEIITTISFYGSNNLQTIFMLDYLNKS